MRSRKTGKMELYENPFGYTVLQNLRDAGCTEDLVERFMDLQEHQDTARQLQLLFAHRKQLLEQLHREEKRIDCLDYLLYQMQNKQ